MTGGMVSFLSRLFGSKSSSKAPSAQRERDEAVEYKGYLIHAAPEQGGGQWRVAGGIRKVDADGEKERILPRADCFATRQDAAAFTTVIGKQVIDPRRGEVCADGGAAGRSSAFRHAPTPAKTGF